MSYVRRSCVYEKIVIPPFSQHSGPLGNNSPRRQGLGWLEFPPHRLCPSVPFMYIAEPLEHNISIYGRRQHLNYPPCTMYIHNFFEVIMDKYKDGHIKCK